MADKRIGVTKIKGKEHVRFKRPDGDIYYDPPLPDDSRTKKRLKSNLAEMVESGQGPDLRGTSAEFFGGMPGKNLGDQYKNDPEGLKSLIAAAKRQGYTPSMNDVYMPNLATSEGQPEAFVKSPDDLKRECIRQGRTCNGSVTVTEADVASTRAKDAEKPRKKVRLAEDIIQERMAMRIAENPEIAVNPQKMADAREDIIETHAPAK